MPTKWRLYVALILLGTGCSAPPSFRAKSNTVSSAKYASRAISLALEDFASTYKIEWLYVDNEWFCRILAESVATTNTYLTLKVKTLSREAQYTLTRRKGGDIYRMSPGDTEKMLQQLDTEGSVLFFIGGTFRQVPCEEFATLKKYAEKKKWRFIEL